MINWSLQVTEKKQRRKSKAVSRRSAHIAKKTEKDTSNLC